MKSLGFLSTLLFLLQPWNYFVHGVEGAACNNAESPYSIVIDGGSTGSRLHIFEFVDSNDVESVTSELVERNEKEGYSSKKCSCVRRGSKKVNVPLSSFKPSSENTAGVSGAVAEHLLPVFGYAAEIIPSEYHGTTSISYIATAGMRLLSEHDQETVYDALYEGLMGSEKFVFRSLVRSKIYTLSGRLEAYYGAVAANYLKGTIGVDLTITNLQQQEETDDNHLDNQQLEDDVDDETEVPFLGALDMGGSSTQIVYFHSSKGSQEEKDDGARETHDQRNKTTTSSNPAKLTKTTKMHGDDFFSTSYLSYGVDQLRNRLWTTWVNERRNASGISSTKHTDDGSDDETEEASCDTEEWISNPCNFKGHKTEWMGYTLIGSGNAHECVQQVNRLIPHPENLHDFHLEEGSYMTEEEETNSTTKTPYAGSHQEMNGNPNGKEGNRFYSVGGIQHPPIPRGSKFYGMSQYFYATDSLRVLSLAPEVPTSASGVVERKHHEEAHKALQSSWPSPTIQELFDALDGLCSRSWYGDLYEKRHDAHKYTSPDNLQHRCFEAVYVATILRDGFGFHPSSQDIIFAYDVEGSEVEWSLGLALVDYAQEQLGTDGDYDAPSTSSAACPTTVEGEAAATTANPTTTGVSADGNNVTDDDDDNEESASSSFWTSLSSLAAGASYAKNCVLMNCVQYTT